VAARFAFTAGFAAIAIALAAGLALMARPAGILAIATVAAAIATAPVPPVIGVPSPTVFAAFAFPFGSCALGGFLPAKQALEPTEETAAFLFRLAPGRGLGVRLPRSRFEPVIVPARFARLEAARLAGLAGLESARLAAFAR
jgi:hypothetical protein